MKTKISLVVILSSLLLASGCGGTNTTRVAGSRSASNDGSALHRVPDNDISFKLNTQDNSPGFAVSNFRQAVQSMNTVAGITYTTNDCKNMVSALEDSLSKSGDISEVSASHLAAIVSLAGCTCDHILTAAKSKGHVLVKGLDLKANAQNQANLFKTEVFPRLASGVWGRPQTEVEVGYIDAALKKVFGASLETTNLNQTETRNAWLLVCTSVFSSMSAQLK